MKVGMIVYSAPDGKYYYTFDKKVPFQGEEIFSLNKEGPDKDIRNILSELEEEAIRRAEIKGIKIEGLE